MRRHFMPTRVLLIALAGALALSGCGSKYTYVKNKQEQVYFKIPKEWETIGVPPDPLRGAEDPPPNWQVLFTAPGYEANTMTLLQSVPNGNAQVINLTRAQAAAISPSEIRKFILTQLDIDEDPLELARRQDPRIDLLDYVELNDRSNLRGLSITYTWKDGPQDSWFTIRHIGMLNDTNNKLYRFRVNCVPQCFLGQFGGDIKTVADSWTVNTRKG